MDSSKIDERLRRLLHGGDGAASLTEMEWGSEGSTETVERKRSAEGVFDSRGFSTAVVREA